MKATKSRDGIDRYTVIAETRVTPEEYKVYSRLAREQGYDSLKEFLSNWLDDGLGQLSGGAFDN